MSLVISLVVPPVIAPIAVTVRVGAVFAAVPCTVAVISALSSPAVFRVLMVISISFSSPDGIATSVKLNSVAVVQPMVCVVPSASVKVIRYSGAFSFAAVVGRVMLMKSAPTVTSVLVGATARVVKVVVAPVAVCPRVSVAVRYT